MAEYSDAVLAARERRRGGAAAADTRDVWFIEQVHSHIALTMRERAALASSYLRDKIVSNISRPVTKVVGTRSDGSSRTIVTDRSKPGEFPKADTTLLMKTIMSGVEETSTDVFDGWVGTPLEYGVILELSEKLDRSYFRRTLREEFNNLKKIVTGPIP